MKTKKEKLNLNNAYANWDGCTYCSLCNANVAINALTDFYAFWNGFWE